MIKDKSQNELAASANICNASARRILAYKDVCFETAQRVAFSVKKQVEDLFEVTHDHRATLKR